MYILATSLNSLGMSFIFFRVKFHTVSDETHDTADYNTRSRESSTEEQWPKDPVNSQSDSRSRHEDQFYDSPLTMSCHPKTSCRFPGQGQFPKSEPSQVSLTAEMSEDIPELRPEVITGLDAFLQDHFIPPIKLANSSVTPPIISSGYHQLAHSDLHSTISHRQHTNLPHREH